GLFGSWQQIAPKAKIGTEENARSQSARDDDIEPIGFISRVGPTHQNESCTMPNRMDVWGAIAGPSIVRRDPLTLVLAGFSANAFTLIAQTAFFRLMPYDMPSALPSIVFRVLFVLADIVLFVGLMLESRRRRTQNQDAKRSGFVSTALSLAGYTVFAG